MSVPLIVWSNAPEPEVAATIARTLVEEGLAACVHVMPAGESFYIWEGALNREREVTLMIKTTVANYPGLEARLLDLHPYDLPEILATPVSAGLSAYVGWLGEDGGNYSGP